MPVPAGAAHKIKGGRWTVFRFFLVSLAFTSAWVAVSSQLAYYRRIHGPAVLLQLNIAYFLPSIPLLIVSAFLDKPLEARLGERQAEGQGLQHSAGRSTLGPHWQSKRNSVSTDRCPPPRPASCASPPLAGVAKTILVRLLVGLVGYGAVCAWFPFMPEHIWCAACTAAPPGAAHLGQLWQSLFCFGPPAYRCKHRWFAAALPPAVPTPIPPPCNLLQVPAWLGGCPRPLWRHRLLSLLPAGGPLCQQERDCPGAGLLRQRAPGSDAAAGAGNGAHTHQATAGAAAPAVGFELDKC